MITTPFALDLKEAYAIAMHVLIAILNSDSALNSTTLHKEYCVSKLYLRNILSRLKLQGFISAVLGAEGGYILSCDPYKVTAMKVYEAIVGKYKCKECLFKCVKCSSPEKCTFYSFTNQVNDNLRQLLENTYLSDFIPVKPKPKRGRKPKEAK